MHDILHGSYDLINFYLCKCKKPPRPVDGQNQDKLLDKLLNYTTKTNREKNHRRHLVHEKAKRRCNKFNEGEQVNSVWDKIKRNITRAANEAYHREE
ncbi:hypothetical protein ABEB36_005920 [Hypothenemus hampei]|uniref:Uncharacterized protein n=1 Tax=Hypothenemus hampei TaxID=57062 RepID=A0ABD1EZV9_HYPHA